MKNLKNITLLLLVAGFVMACNCKKKAVKEEVAKSNLTTNKIVVQPGYAAPSTTDKFTVDNAIVEGDNLIVYVSYGGGCKDHEFKAFAGDVYMKSVPPKLEVFIEHEANEDLCKAIVKDTLTFDLSTVKYPGKDKDYSVVLTINNWKGDILYKY